MTVSQAYESWQLSAATELKASTRKVYRSAWSWLARAVGECDVTAVSQATARQLMGVMREEETSPATMRSRIYTLRMVLRHASELGEPVRPTDWSLRYPRSYREEVRTFDEREVRTLLTAIEERMRGGDFLQLPALVSLMTGMRISEVCGLKWRDIESGGKTPHIKVRRQAHVVYMAGERIPLTELKSESGYRTVPLLPQLRNALRAYGGARPEADRYVIGNGTEPQTPRGVRANFRRMVYGLPVSKLKFHCLRHTYATRLVATGKQVTAVTKIMGHSSTAITLDLYVHPAEDYKRKMARKAFRTTESITFRL